MVFRCPSTSKAIFEQTRKSGCDQTLQYHCLRTQNGGLIEKCLEISWIQKGNCAIFNSNAEQVDAVKCNENLGICPQKQYLSNEVMSYSACVHLPEMPSLTTDYNGKNYTASPVTSKLPSDGRAFNPGDTQNRILVPIIVALLLFVLVVLSVAVVVYKRRKRSASTELRKSKGDEEMIPLQTTTESKENTRGARESKCCELDAYYKTRTYEYLEKLTGDSAVSILIVGEPGSGKSVLGEMLYRRFRRQTVKGKYHISQYLKSLEDIDKNPREKGNPSHENPKMIYIIDDCFEIWEQYPHMASANLNKLQEVHDQFVIGNGHCLVITISKRNFEKNLSTPQKNKLKESDMLKIIDLSSKDFDLDITDKTGILEYHRNLKGSMSRRMGNEALRKVTVPNSPNKLASIISYLSQDSQLELQFPLSCCLFYIHDFFEEKKEIFFAETKKATKGFVEGLLKGSYKEKCQYCTLIYMALRGGKINAMKRKDDAFLGDIAKVANIDPPNVDFNFECCLITKGKDATYQIVHEEITRQLFRVFGFHHTGFVIKMCDAQVLLQFLRTEDKKRRDEYRAMGFLIITNNFYHCLATKLRKMDLEKQRHVIFEDAKFDKIFREAKGNSHFKT